MKKSILSIALGCLVAVLALTGQDAEAAAHKSAKSSKAAKATKAVKGSSKSASKPSSAKPAARAAAKSSVKGGSKIVGKAAGKAAARVSSRGALTARARHVSLRAVDIEPPKASFGQIQGLHAAHDPLELKSSVALVVDQDTNEVLINKNAQAVLPIASITKLMTAMVVLEAKQSMNDVLAITDEDIDTEKGSRSRLVVGTQLTRGEMLHLALMSSENRAANALARHYPGGLNAAVAAMNRKAQALGMADTRYVEPTGLSSQNQSSAHDLALLVKTAYQQQPMMRELSTSPEAAVEVGHRTLQFRNTNGLVRDPQWEIGLQKTGYISEAGRCLVMQAQLAGRKLILVLLDSAGKYSRIGDAERIRRWLSSSTTHNGVVAPVQARATS